MSINQLKQRSGLNPILLEIRNDHAPISYNDLVLRVYSQFGLQVKIIEAKIQLGSDLKTGQPFWVEYCISNHDNQ